MLQDTFFTDIQRDPGPGTCSWLSNLGVNKKTKAGVGKARRKEREWTMKLSSIPGADHCVSISCSKFPPTLFSLTLPIYVNIKEHYLLPYETLKLAGLWLAHRWAGKWLQRRVRSVTHSPWMWAQGFQVGRNPTQQPLWVHPSSPLMLSRRLVTTRGGKKRGIICNVLSGIHFPLPKNYRLPHAAFFKTPLIYRPHNKEGNEICILFGSLSFTTCLRK